MYLQHLIMRECWGPVMFTQNLITLVIDMPDLDDEDVGFLLEDISANSSTLSSIDIYGNLELSVNLLHIIKTFPLIETLKYVSFNSMVLKNNDFEAIASLPRLKHLDIGGNAARNAVNGLSSCKRLVHLRVDSPVDLSAILPSIGKNLKHLDIKLRLEDPWERRYLRRVCADGIVGLDAILKYCNNLEELCLRFNYVAPGVVDLLERAIKGDMKKLKKLRIADKFIRLGTDWEGH
jgi:hypothetical protein